MSQSGHERPQDIALHNGHWSVLVILYAPTGFAEHPFAVTPLHVYLDSSDFTRLAQPSPEFAPIRQQLDHLVSEGAISICLSAVHVAEAAPIRPEHLKHARLRFHCMRELCGNNVLAAIEDIMDAEAHRIIGAPPIDKLEIYRDDRDWLPRHVARDIKFPSREELIASSIAQLPRAQRRAINRQLLKQDGKLTRSADAAIAQTAIAFSKAVGQQYPLTPAAEKLLRGYVVGTVDGTIAVSAVLESIKDLDVLSAWLDVNWAEVSPINAWVREAAVRMTNGLSTAAEQAKAVWKAQQGSGLGADQIDDICSRVMNDVRRTFPFRIAQSIVGTAASQAIPENYDCSDLAPSLTVAGDITFAIARMAFAPPYPRPLKPSDGVDVMHAMYLPHVDVYRADAFMADVIGKVARRYRTRVVGSLLELPQAIKSLTTSTKS